MEAERVATANNNNLTIEVAAADTVNKKEEAVVHQLLKEAATMELDKGIMAAAVADTIPHHLNTVIIIDEHHWNEMVHSKGFLNQIIVN